MGGNALKNIETRRYEKKEFFEILLEVGARLSGRGIVSEVPKWYRNKETFGDLDVMIKSSTVEGNILDVINDLFEPNEIYNNNDVKSFDYKDFQIDFIMVGDKNWETSLFYFSYNDLGNFVGRISYQMGFRFGDYGLKLVYRHEDGGRKFSKIVSKDPRKIYEFLGFDYDRYLEGFDEVEDIFKFVVLSKRFNREIFNYENLNHQNRTRNKKRKNYELFLEYVKTSDNILPFDYEFKSKDYYLEKAESFFDVELTTEINRWKELVAIEKEASKKFNGNVIMEYFPLKGKELGNAIKNFHNYFDDLNPKITKEQKKEYISKWIIEHDLEVILGIFSFANNLNKKDKLKNL
jgi:hypothetical protein